MDIKRLYAFARIVDIGSITRAATILRIAQPALSQQIAALEAHFSKLLLLRSKRGVVPTEAGRIPYAIASRSSNSWSVPSLTSAAPPRR